MSDAMPNQGKAYPPIISVPLITQRQRNVTDQTSLAVLHIAKALISLWAERARQRRALRHLDDRLLDDIGLTREQAQKEASKPFWR